MKKLFGTDGIRGVAGQSPLDPATIRAVGLALAHHLAPEAPGQSPRVLIGMDTRESSDWIASALTAGLTAGGATVESAGVITTPAVAYLARAHSFSAGIVISASHNPWQDNGIKLFGPDGYKLPDATELAIEARNLPPPRELHPLNLAPRTLNLRRSTTPTVPSTSASCSPPSPASPSTAAAWSSTAPTAPPAAVAPQLFAELNANGGGEVIFTHASPNGRNINADCGALHPEVVAAEVVKHQRLHGHHL